MRNPSFATVNGLWPDDRGRSKKSDDDDDARLPRQFAKDDSATLVRLAKRRNLIVRPTGGERYIITDNRGHILLRDAGPHTAKAFLYNRRSEP
jgi:hypothetical protein